MDRNHNTLRRTISLPQLVLYGLGTTVGAGIYALTGEVARLAGYGAPLSFLVASLLAGFTALSFAELSGRFPRAAGAALYVQQGWGGYRLSRVAGLLMALAGLVSAAALVNAFVAQLQGFVDVARIPGVVLMCTAVVGVAAWGMRTSVWVATLITLVEVGGLLMVVWASHTGWTDASRLDLFLEGASSSVSLSGVFLGAVLAFYAFIGFEDMVDVTEEVRAPRRTMPWAIVLTLLLVTVLYVMIMLAAVLAAPPALLAEQVAPLVFLYQQYRGGEGLVLAVIGLFAIINGALIQTIMASRVLYGLASRNQLPAWLARVNSRTHTPLAATLVTGVVLLLLALGGRLASLAELTSVLVLAVFALVNVSLWRIKQREPLTQGFCVPSVVPVLGAVTCAAFLLFRLVQGWI